MPLLQTFGNATARAYGFGLSSAASYELISSNLISTNTANLQLQSIPQGYKHLQLRWTLRDSGAFTYRGAFIEINGNTVTGSNSQHFLYGNGSSVTSASGTNLGRFDIANVVPAANATSGSYGVGIVDILDYTSTTKNKTIRGMFGIVQPGDITQVELYSSMWNSTSALNWLTIYTNNNMIAGSRVSLYGVRG
jgi:hypothetical protein